MNSEPLLPLLPLLSLPPPPCPSAPQRNLLFHDTVAPHLAAYAPEASAAQQRDFLTHLHQTLNAPSHPIRNRLLRLTADSPDLLAIIKQEGKV